MSGRIRHEPASGGFLLEGARLRVTDRVVLDLGSGPSGPWVVDGTEQRLVDSLAVPLAVVELAYAVNSRMSAHRVR